MNKAAIQDAQKALMTLGYALPIYGADGMIGAETRTAVRRFGAAHNLPSSGRLTEALVVALTALAAASTQGPEGVQGCDVSGWQRPSDIDWNELHDDGLRFAIVKATQGGTGVSKRFAPHVKQAKAAGLLTGAYHFASFKGRRKDQPREQADHFVSTVEGIGGVDLPLVLDAEWQHYDTKALREADLGVRYAAFPATAVNDFIAIFGARVLELTGRQPILYTGRSFFRYRMAATDQHTAWPLWQASYVGDGHELPDRPPTSMTPPWDIVTIHQFAGGKGRAPDGDGDGDVGFTKPLDRNLFMGSLDELKEL